MIIPNGSLYTQMPVSHMGYGIGVHSKECFLKSEMWMCPNTATGYNRTSSVPVGYDPVHAFFPAMTYGGLGTTARGILGSGDISGTGNLGWNLLADLVGSGDMTAFGGMIVNLIATISGDGDITDADMKAFLLMVANVVASGDVTAALSADAEMIAALAGACGVVSILTATGTLGANIKAYGELTPEAVRDAVWNAIAASFNKSGTMGNKLNSASAAGDPWTAIMAGYTDDATFGAFVKQLLTQNKFIALKD